MQIIDSTCTWDISGIHVLGRVRLQNTHITIQTTLTHSRNTGHCEDDFGDHAGNLFPPYLAGTYVMSSLTLRTLSCKFQTIRRSQFYPSEDVLTGVLLNEANVRIRTDRKRFTFLSPSHSPSNWICALNIEASDPSAISPSSSSVVSLERMSNILGYYFPAVSRSAKLLIGVLSAPKNIERRKKIRETWLKYYDSQSSVSSREYHVWFIVGHADCEQNDREKMEILMKEAAKYVVVRGITG